MKNKILITAIAATVLLSLCLKAYAENKVGYINVQGVVSGSRLGKKAQAEIAKFREKSVKEIAIKREELQALSNKIAERQKKSAKGGLVEKFQFTKIEDLVESLQQKNKAFKRLVFDIKEEIAKKDKGLVAEILKKADPLLKRIAKKRGYSIILRNAASLAYLDPEVDLTQMLIEELDKKHK